MKSQMDLFEAAATHVPTVARPKPVARRSPGAPAAALSDDDMARHLEGTGQYRILRRLVPRAVVAEPRPGFPRIGVMVDTETTGLSKQTAEVIEIGAIAFTYDDDGNFGDVIGVFGGLQQPSKPIPAEITTLTGITDAMVAGQEIDHNALRRMIEPADLIIAHNAGFDRSFCEKLCDSFTGKAWACSVAEVDWKTRGFEGTKLGYLIGQSGYFHDGHRAVDDCFALLEVLLGGDDGQEGDDSAFAELCRSSQRSTARIWAENSPFDMKEKLKSRSYRWSDGTDGRAKSWWCEIPAEKVEDELRFLRTEVYHRADASPPVQYVSAADRYK